MQSNPEHKADINEEVRELLRKLLILELFKSRVPQVDIAKKLRMNLNDVNNFLKGIRKD